jgi:predicted DNA-binding transcriptional regulator AlpA
MTTNPPPLVKLSALRRTLGVSDETVRRWRAQGKLPPADVDLGGSSVWWHQGTLAAAGINLQPPEPAAASQTTPASS